MAIPGIVPQPIDAQLAGQVPVPAGVPQQPIVPQAPAQAQVQPQVPVQAPAPQMPVPQAQPQQPQEPPGPLGIPNSQVMKVIEQTRNPNARLQAAQFLGTNVPAPSDEEVAALLAYLETGGE